MQANYELSLRALRTPVLSVVPSRCSNISVIRTSFVSSAAVPASSIFFPPYVFSFEQAARLTRKKRVVPAADNEG